MVRINNKWCDDESYQFHITDKTIIRNVLFGKCKEIDLLKEIVIKDDWKHFDKPEEEPPNMKFLRDMFSAYKEEIKSKRIKPPLKEKLVLNKVLDFVETLYLQDSAYLERIGGVITWFVVNGDKWKGQKKEMHLKLLMSCHDWWDKEDFRERTRWMIEQIWTCLIQKYQKTDFYYKSVEFLVDYMVEHKSDWIIIEFYDPKNWFARGRGSINNLVHGGMG